MRHCIRVCRQPTKLERWVLATYVPRLYVSLRPRWRGRRKADCWRHQQRAGSGPSLSDAAPGCVCNWCLNPSQKLPVAPPPLSTPLQPPREQIAKPIPEVASSPPPTLLLTPREATPQPFAPVDPQPPTPTPIKLLQSQPTLIQPVIASNKKVSEQPIVLKAAKVKSTPVKHVPRRSTQYCSAPLCLGYDGQQRTRLQRHTWRHPSWMALQQSCWVPFSIVTILQGKC